MEQTGNAVGIDHSDESEELAAALQRLKRENRRLNDLELATGRAHLRSVPPHLEVDFSIQCNFRCLMCHQSKFDFEPTELDADETNAVVDALPYIDTLLIAGLGEPLLYKPLDRFLRLSSLLGCEAAMFTNGLLIDRRFDVFAHLSRVNVSFDGGRASTFERLRVGADFDRIVRALAELRVRYPKLFISFSTVVSSPNVPEIGDILEHAARLGVNEVNLSPVNHTPELDLKISDWPVFQAQLERAHGIAAEHGIRINDNMRSEHFIVPDGRRLLHVFPERPKRSELPKMPPRREPSGEAWAALLHEPVDRILQRVTTAIARTEAFIQELESEIRRDGVNEISEPYCSAPWKYMFAQNDGTARLCPYLNLDIGRVANGVLRDYNGIALEGIRKSLAEDAPRVQECRRCIDDHRHFRLGVTRETCSSLGIHMGPRKDKRDMAIPALPPRKFPADRLHAYATAGVHEVGGWLGPLGIRAFLEVGAVQDIIAVRGDVCEVGVFEGRSFLLAYLQIREAERAIAVDTFADDPARRDRFFENLNRHAGDCTGVLHLALDSASLAPADLLGSDEARVRLFSIDGGHDARQTENALSLAERSLHPRGAILLDDCFNEEWPGVQEGLARHLIGGSGLRPIWIGGNKVVLVPAAAVDLYDAIIAAKFPKALRREHFGRQVLVVQPEATG